ncbi:MAG: hypothetical protein WC263_00595 [Candidatus Micrarchaeia archaeon]|jgi:hypothetical protein
MAKNGRILDREFEAGITGRAGEIRKEAAGRIGEIQREAQLDITKAQKYAYAKNEDIEAMIREHPKAFVLGSFIGGVALGTLLAKRD